jgi:EAL domain-containing protein (putative c-di-GMP-specific phosphodiesterase class I)
VQHRSSPAIVHWTVALGYDLGLEVVAEGVESRRVWERLAEMGCDVVQGYLIGRPMPAEDFEAWQRDSPWCAGGPPTPVTGTA